MITTTATPARRFDRERAQTAVRAAQALIIDQISVAHVATAYAMTPAALADLLADLAHDLAVAAKVQS